MNIEAQPQWTQKWMLRPVARCCRGSSIVRVAPAGKHKMKITKEYIRKIIREVIVSETPDIGGLPFSWPTRRVEVPESEEIYLDMPKIEQKIQDILDSWDPRTEEGQQYENDIEILLNDIRSSSND